MGEDIHTKAYIKSKVGSAAGRYVSAMTVMPTFIANKTEDFCDVFNYRSKAVFSLFGSTQGEWAKIPQLNDGFPDWLMQDCPTDAAFLKMPCKNYYGFTWIKLSDLKLALIEYRDALSDIRKYYSKFEDEAAYEPLKELLDGVGGSIGSQGKDFIRNWNETAEGISEKLASLYKHVLSLEEKYGTPDYKALFDIEDTVFIYWFD